MGDLVLKKYIGLILILIFAAGFVSAEKINRPQIRQIDLDVQQIYSGDQTKKDISSAKATSFDSCSTQIFNFENDDLWAIDKWIWGEEWYFAYIDPEITCQFPYPFGVREVHFYMAYDMSYNYDSAVFIDTFIIQLSTVNLSDINCPKPGDTITNSIPFEVVVDTGGLWDMTFLLSDTVEVNEPFFAGIYIADRYQLDTTVSGTDTSIYPKSFYPDIVTDVFESGHRDTCRSLNIFFDDTTLTFVALDTLKTIEDTDTTYWFPGRLVMFTEGLLLDQPPPEVKLASPVLQTGSFITVNGDIKLWGHEFSGSNIDMIFKYEYNVGGSTYEFIDENTSGGSILRDGIHNFGNSDPFIANWDVSALSPGGHFLKVTATDTLGRISFAEQEVLLSKISIPIPIIQTPSDGIMFCDTIDFLYSNLADELDSINLFIQPVNLNYIAKVTPLNQNDYSDEFEDYYNAPVAAASALKTWYDRGITELMTDGTDPITIDTLVERLAQQFKTRENFGTYDEDLYTGLVSYLRSINNSKILLDFKHKPNYFDIRKKVEVENQIVLLGLGNDPGKWVVVEGFKGWRQIDGSFTITVMDPTAGTFIDMNFINSFPSEVSYNGKTQKVDLMVMVKSTDAVSYDSLVSADIDGLNDWAIEWIPDGLTDNSPYFFNSVGYKGNLSELNSVLLNYSCAETYFAGDYNGDEENNINDYLILQTYIIERVSPPLGGAYRADANGDNNINIADLIYYLNFLFGNVSTPAY